jgi:hypothetical protein
LSAFADSPKARQPAVREVDGDVGEKDAAWGADQRDARQLRQIALAAMFVLAGGDGQQRDNEWKMRTIVLRTKSEQPASRVVFRKGLA